MYNETSVTIPNNRDSAALTICDPGHPKLDVNVNLLYCLYFATGDSPAVMWTSMQGCQIAGKQES